MNRGTREVVSGFDANVTNKPPRCSHTPGRRRSREATGAPAPAGILVSPTRGHGGTRRSRSRHLPPTRTAHGRCGSSTTSAGALTNSSSWDHHPVCARMVAAAHADHQVDPRTQVARHGIESSTCRRPPSGHRMSRGRSPTSRNACDTLGSGTRGHPHLVLLHRGVECGIEPWTRPREGGSSSREA